MEVVIPTYRPDATLREILERLCSQSLRPRRILVINTGREFWDSSLEKDFSLLEVRHIRKADFDHGGTRHQAMKYTRAPFVCFMTQDAIPENDRLLEELRGALESTSRVGAAYARQLPRPDSKSPEREVRLYNYPDDPEVRGKEDMGRYGVKTFFCSNVCAAYRREIYERVGGFPRHTIFNEDMIYVGHMIEEGYQVAYVPTARVFHSHNYSLSQQLARNFDLGVSQREHPEVFAKTPSEGEGLRCVASVFCTLGRRGKVLSILRLVADSAAKYLGYRLGMRYDTLPPGLVEKLSMNPSYFAFHVGDGNHTYNTIDR